MLSVSVSRPYLDSRQVSHSVRLAFAISSPPFPPFCSPLCSFPREMRKGSLLSYAPTPQDPPDRWDTGWSPSPEVWQGWGGRIFPPPLLSPCNSLTLNLPSNSPPLADFRGWVLHQVPPPVLGWRGLTTPRRHLHPLSFPDHPTPPPPPLARPGMAPPPRLSSLLSVRPRGPLSEAMVPHRLLPVSPPPPNLKQTNIFPAFFWSGFVHTKPSSHHHQ